MNSILFFSPFRLCFGEKARLIGEAGPAFFKAVGPADSTSSAMTLAFSTVFISCEKHPVVYLIM